MNLNVENQVNNDSGEDEQESDLTVLNKKKVHERKKYKNKNNNNKHIYINCITFLMILIIFIISFSIIFFIISLKYDNNSDNSIDNYNINISNFNINESKRLNNISNNSNNTIEVKNIENNIIKNISNNNTENNNNKKLTIAFVFSSLFANGIARFITVTANYLMETGKYDIYFITGKQYIKDYKYNEKIKRVFIHNNYTLIRNFTKYVKIDFFILQNALGKNIVDFYRSLGKKVIVIFHGLYMSALFHGYVSSYRNWDQFDYYDAFIFISYDDYYFYKKLGYKNAIFIPNLYTFEPSKIKESNLTNHNIVMLGRAADKVKGFIYAVKTMPYIIKEVPDAILNIYSSNYNVNELKDLVKQLNVSNNVNINYYIENITQAFWNSSVVMYTSLSEAFPMAMVEAKAHGMPIVAFNVPYSVPYQSGVINVEMLDCEALAKETIKLLKDYNYRKKMGEISKLSLNQFSNNETVELWGRLFNSLLEGEEAYRKLQYEIEKKYYNEESAKNHVEKHYEALLRYNKNFTCHNINNFIDINYVKKIEMCNITNKTNGTNGKNITN